MTKQERFCELIGAHWSKLRTLFTGVTCYMLTIDMSVIIAKKQLLIAMIMLLYLPTLHILGFYHTLGMRKLPLQH